MAGGHIRRDVTAFVQTLGGTTRTIGRDLITMREEMFSARLCGDPAQLSESLQRQARELQEATNAARSLPVLGGAYFIAEPFATVGSQRTFVHGLFGAVAWIACRMRPSFAVRQASTAYNQGDLVVPAAANGYWYSCYLPGTTAAGVPTYSTFTGAQFTDNAVTWNCQGPIAPAIYEVSQDATNGRIALAASCPMTVDLWFYPQPSAQGF